MTAYVGTFFSHYDAIQFTHKLEAQGISSKMMPVPRKVNSSCGTAVRFEVAEDVQRLMQEGVDQIYRVRDDGTYIAVL